MDMLLEKNTLPLTLFHTESKRAYGIRGLGQLTESSRSSLHEVYRSAPEDNEQKW